MPEPWMYLIAPVAALVLTVGLLAASRRHISVATTGIGILVCFLGVVTFDFSWLQPEVVGDLPKMSALILAMLLPVVLPTSAYVVTGSLRPLLRVGVSAAAGILGVIAFPYVGLVLVCALAGDCL